MFFMSFFLLFIHSLRCPRETVTFFEAPDAKNTIRFSFSMTEQVDLLNITQAFIHCFPGIL